MFPVLYIITSYKINMWLAYLITGSLSLFIPQEIGRFYHVTIPHPLPSGSIQFVLWICESVSVLFVRLFCFYIPQRSENTQCFRRCREKGTFLHCCRNVNGCSHCGKQYGGSSKNCGSDGKASAYNAGDPDSIPQSGRSPGEENGNPLQYSYLGNSMDGGGL